MFTFGVLFLLSLVLAVSILNIFLTQFASLKAAPSLPQPLLTQGTAVCGTMVLCSFATQTVPGAEAKTEHCTTVKSR